MSPRQKKVAGYTAATAGFAGVNAAIYGIVGHDSFHPVTPVDLIAGLKAANQAFPYVKRAVYRHVIKPQEPTVIRSNRYKTVKEEDEKNDYRSKNRHVWKKRDDVHYNNTKRFPNAQKRREAGERFREELRKQGKLKD